MPRPPLRTESVPDEPPPFFSSWGRLYLAVAGYLVLVIVFFDLFTRTLNQ